MLTCPFGVEGFLSKHSLFIDLLPLIGLFLSPANVQSECAPCR